MRLPTDREILGAIYDQYYPTFAAFSKTDKGRSAKIYVPVNCTEVAKRFGVDDDIVFGRLYYHLQRKHGYKDEDGSQVPFFSLRIAGDSHCVNFPLLASVLASMQQEESKFRWATGLSITSAAISLSALTLSVLTFLSRH